MRDTMWNVLGYAMIGVFAALVFLVGFGGAVMNWPFVEDVIGYAPLVLIGGIALVAALVLLSKGLDYLPEKAFDVFIVVWAVGWSNGPVVRAMFEPYKFDKVCYIGSLLMAFSLPGIRALAGGRSGEQPKA